MKTILIYTLASNSGPIYKLVMLFRALCQILRQEPCGCIVSLASSSNIMCLAMRLRITSAVLGLALDAFIVVINVRLSLLGTCQITKVKHISIPEQCAFD